MSFFNKSILLEAANSADIPQVTGSGGGKYSVSIVNSDGHGKRMTLSKGLVERLDLSGSVSILPLKKQGVLLLARELPFPKVSKVELTSKDNRIAYNAEVVHLLTEIFGLDYTRGRTSYSFSNVEFMNEDGVEIAVVQMSKPQTESAGEESA